MPLPPVVAARLDGWKRKLIDLSRSNRLLHYRHHRASSVRIVREDPREVVTLVLGGKRLAFDAMLEGELGLETSKAGDLRLQTDLPQDRLEKVLAHLERDARSSIEEQGFNTLFVALGILEFRLPDDPDVWRAPLLLVPVALSRRGVKGAFALGAYDDTPRVNPALALKLENHVGLRLAVPELSDPPSYDAVRAVFDAACAGRDGWRVVDEIHLAPFSFAKLSLYEDLVRHGELIGARPIVASIASGTPSPELGLGPLPTPQEVEAAPEASAIARILDADSSQEAAILAARRGQSFVLEGPPGTGKSQTIANVIADSLSMGKKVLFVSEKMAALEVVQARLERAGLGDFCLELHSNKAKKREVVQSLARAWRSASAAAARATGRPADLASIEAHLRTYAEEVGKPRGAAGLATHKILGEAARLRPVPEIPFVVADPASIDAAALQRALALLRETAAVRAAVEPVSRNAWLRSRRTALGVSTTDEVRRALNRVREVVTNVRGAANGLAGTTGMASPASVADATRALEVAAHLRSTPEPDPRWLEGSTWPGLSPRAASLLAAGVERQGLVETLLATYEPAALSIDASALLVRMRPGGFVFGWFRRRRAKTELGAMRKAQARTTNASVVAELRGIARAADLRTLLEGERSWLSETLGDGYSGLESDWRRLAAHGGWVARWVELSGGTASSDRTRSVIAGAGLDALDAAASSLRETLATLDARRRELAALLKVAADAAAPDSFDAIGADGVAMLDAMDALPDWAAWQRKRAECSAAGLAEYLDAFDARDERSEHLLNAWFRGYYRAFADRLLADVPVLADFQERMHETRTARYRTLEGEALGAAAARVAAGLRAKVPSMSVGTVAASEVGILKKQAALERPRLPTRALFDQIPTLLRTLKPCLMMSPLSVATYLPADAEPFDLVVFDEASQICTEDAIGALARAKQAIVAGDSKQLPPTAFFESRLAESDDAPEDALVDLKSVLEECSSGPIPSHPLLWHYRSRDESLISFSNAQFYGDSLVTFPSAARDPQRLGISLVHVEDGVYTPKVATNVVEAQAVVDRLFRLLAERPGDSVGVVTFSTTQRDAILDLIDARRRTDESFEPRFSGEAVEPVFVKNLEAVQGDERDVILFSVCYGFDAQRAFHHNFGPLNKDGGERRLNVAVSRSRKQMIVFASIVPEDIDLSRVSSKGPRLLRAFLERARRGLLGADAAAAARDPETLSPLVRTVVRTLTDQGYAAHPCLGESGFRVDVAVRHPTDPHRFALAVLCDGPADAPGSAPREGVGGVTTRDRERVRPEVLERLGWSIHRAWSPDWLRFPDRAAERLRAAIDAACRAKAADVPGASAPRPAATGPTDAGDTAAESTDAVPPRESAILGIVDYVAARLRQGRSSETYFERDDRVEAALIEVVTVESPVHLEVAARRVAQSFDIDRLTPRVLDRMSSVAGLASVRGVIVRRDAFLYAVGAAAVVARRPAAEFERAFEQIAPDEVAAAARAVATALVSVSPDALARETARALGFVRPSDTVLVAIARVVEADVAAGRLVRDARGWIRAQRVSALPSDLNT